jgi:hypothetical protein
VRISVCLVCLVCLVCVCVCVYEVERMRLKDNDTCCSDNHRIICGAVHFRFQNMFCECNRIVDNTVNLRCASQ